MNPRRFVSYDWDAVAGIIAAVIAIVMHFLHWIDEGVLMAIAVVLIALLFLRDLRSERSAEEAHAATFENLTILRSIQSSIAPTDVELIGPGKIRSASERFAAHARGEMIWFHVCLSMFKPQSLFDALLRPAIENPHVTSIHFILDEGQKALWDTEVSPKINRCRGKDKVHAPCWTKIRESVSVISITEASTGRTEGLLSFWGEPFMAHSTDRQIPRYIFHVHEHSELITRLVELIRAYRIAQ